MPFCCWGYSYTLQNTSSARFLRSHQTFFADFSDRAPRNAVPSSLTELATSSSNGTRPDDTSFGLGLHLNTPPLPYQHETRQTSIRTATQSFSCSSIKYGRHPKAPPKSTTKGESKHINPHPSVILRHPHKILQLSQLFLLPSHDLRLRECPQWATSHPRQANQSLLFFWWDFFNLITKFSCPLQESRNVTRTPSASPLRTNRDLCPIL